MIHLSQMGSLIHLIQLIFSHREDSTEGSSEIEEEDEMNFGALLLGIKMYRSIYEDVTCSGSIFLIILHVGLLFFSTYKPDWCQRTRQQGCIPSAETAGCSNASFQGLPMRLQEVIRGKYVLFSSSSSSFSTSIRPACFCLGKNWF